jgi:phospholipid/cholesterol/gamma-HCH transport system permease protein
LPAATEVQPHLDTTPRVWRLAFDTHDLTAWDSGLLTFVRQVRAQSMQCQIVVDQRGLPEGVQRLLALAAAVPEREGARRSGQRLSWLARLGTAVLAGWQGAWDMLGFLGEAVLTCLRLVVGKARFRRVDLVLFVQECGAQALGVVTLISFLIGLILAFMGAIQLRQFGAQLYVADLVGLGMTREMGAITTGILMAGRTGAAFAAHRHRRSPFLGTVGHGRDHTIHDLTYKFATASNAAPLGPLAGRRLVSCAYHRVCLPP